MTPSIQECQWGKIIIEGSAYQGAVLYSEGVAGWETLDTSYIDYPKLRLSLVEYLLSFNPKAIVVGLGYRRKLEVPFEAAKKLMQSNVDFLLADTERAVNYHNHLVEYFVDVVTAIHTGH